MQRSRRTWGPGSPRAPPASGAARATVEATSRTAGRSRPGTGRSGRHPGSSGVRATGPVGGCPQRLGRAPRMPDRAPSRQPRTGKSQCNRLSHNAIGCSTRLVRPRRPERRRWPTRYRPAARPVSPSWGPTVPTTPTAHTAPDRSPATTNEAPFCRNRSPTSPQVVESDPPDLRRRFRMPRPGRDSRCRQRCRRRRRVRSAARSPAGRTGRARCCACSHCAVQSALRCRSAWGAGCATGSRPVAPSSGHRRPSLPTAGSPCRRRRRTGRVPAAMRAGHQPRWSPRPE